jgi:MFS family permease
MVNKEAAMQRTFHWHDYITINIYYLGLSTLSQTMAPLVVPLLVQQFVGEQAKATFYGNVRLWGLMVALLAQALWGMLSDRSASRLGRRRPFIFFGTLADLGFIAAIGFSAGLSGMSGYWMLFAMYLLLQVSSNAAQGAQQGLIPDLVPLDQRGRFSAVKAILEVPLPVILVSFTIGKLIGAGNMWGGILVAVGVLVLSMLLTMLVREEPLQTKPPALREAWTPFLRLVLMTALFTAIILGMGEAIKLTGHLMEGVSEATTLFVVMGAVGVLAMAVAVALGVWISVRIGVGQAARDAEHSSFTWWIVNRLAFLVGAFNLSSFAVYFLQARLGLVREKAAGPAATLMLFVGVFILLFATIGGWLADRPAWSHKRLVAIAGFVAALGTLIAILAPDLTIIYIGGCFIGAATGIFYTANWALGTELVPKAEAGRYLGISNLAGAGAGAVGAYIGGPIADYFTVRVANVPGLGYVLLFAIYGVLFLLSVVALSRVKEPGK